MRVLAYTSPARGHLFPMVAILQELARRGHQIALRTLASQVPDMRELGFAAAPVDERIEAIAVRDYLERGPRPALRSAIRTFCARAPYEVDDVQRAIADAGPDVLLVDVNCWGAVAAAERWDGAWATMYPYPMALGSRDVPPFGPGLPPARGALGRSRDRLLRPLVTGTLERILLPPLNELRANLSLAPLAGADDMFTRPPLVLYLTASPFEYPRRDWPANVVMTGPVEWEPPLPDPDWLDTLDRPLVLVTTSSEFQDDGRLVQTAFDALADAPVQVVATVPAGDPAGFRVPANARVAHFLPHAALLRRAACAVTHGGMGATQKALARGVPVCVVPFGRDQLEVARRVQVAGAGTRLPAARLRPDRLRAAIRAAMDCRNGAARVAAGYAAAGGAPAAADAVERQLAGRPC